MVNFSEIISEFVPLNHGFGSLGETDLTNAN